MKVAGFTSTGSKSPRALFGEPDETTPARMVRSTGCRVEDSEGREYLDFIMALGAVALGYARPEVNRAAVRAIRRGTVGPLAPELEEKAAEQLEALLPFRGQVRFLKTGAEAVAAAVRLARLATGRDHVLTCGYHGWLDWCSAGPGVPAGISAFRAEIPFNDAEGTAATIQRMGDRLACVVVEPVIEAAPAPEWLEALRTATREAGALVVFDEIKTALRVSLAGAAGRWGGEPDLVVMGKAIANGFPLAAVAGRSNIMDRVRDTWISSTLATECVSLAAAVATVETANRRRLPGHLAEIGGRLYGGLERLAERFPGAVAGVVGIAEMCCLRYTSQDTGGLVARECARRGLLFKRDAYNFVSLAHGEAEVDEALGTLEEVLSGLPC